ncbi:MAG: cytochrome C [Deltaproteobacteria bacterium]
MKAMKVSVIILAAAFLALGAGTTYAFHGGGVADCAGCHSMHSPAAGSGTLLLKGSDPSSTCLNCHMVAGATTPSSYHILTTDADRIALGGKPANYTPGGDFQWVRIPFTFTAHGETTNETGDSHGHNIVAVDHGMTADATNAQAPGGSFQSNALHCNSCHDQHGQFRRLVDDTIVKTGYPIMGSGSTTKAAPTATAAVGTYRLLAGSGYSTTAAGAIGYLGAPAAISPSSYNHDESDNQVRVSYGVGNAAGNTTWGNWCKTCHAGMHSSGNTVHPVDQTLNNTFASNYQTYMSSGKMTNTSDNSYLSLVPYAVNSGSYNVIKSFANDNDSNLTYPTQGAQVMCLSCHRAHASGFPEMLRWYGESEFLTTVSGGNVLWPSSSIGRNQEQANAAYYNRPASSFGAYQRVLCNKCHAKD